VTATVFGIMVEEKDNTIIRIDNFIIIIKTKIKIKIETLTMMRMEEPTT